MKLQYAEQLDFSSIVNNEFDLIIAASGYESRCVRLIEKIKPKKSKCVALCFRERSDLKQRKLNDSKFKKFGFDLIEVNEGSCDNVISILNGVIENFKRNESLKVLVDYSCMTKVWYATIVNFFVNKEGVFNSLELTFSYSPSVYSDPQLPMPNKYMGPIPGLYRISTSNKPTALIIGLGYEKDRAEGIYKYLDPEETFAFYANPTFEDKFVEIVKKNNANLISTLGPEKVYEYPIDDLNTTDSLLTSLYLNLKKDYRVILAPLGPKPFALQCLLLSARYPDIDVWRVSAGSSGNVYDRKPYDTDPIICTVNFSKDI